ncbi:MAG: hypothetical protein RLZ47_397 [Bacteroidota bacterium]|jgi:hypothetical protein
MEPLEKLLDKTDLFLYKKILNLIIRDWDTMDSQRLGDLLDKLRELHQNLDGVVLQKKQSSMFDKRYYQSNFDRGSVDETNWSTGMSLKGILQTIREQ